MKRPAAPLAKAKPAARPKAAALAAPPAPAPDAKPLLRKAAKAPAAVPPLGYSYDDIALRAYFIAEKRRGEGRHAESHEDWLEAERQLKAEHSASRSAKLLKKK